jgi:transposase
VVWRRSPPRRDRPRDTGSTGAGIGANAALYRVVIVRMRWHPATLAYTKRRLAEGKTKAEIIRCLKRYVAREAFRHLLHRSGVDASPPAA